MPSSSKIIAGVLGVFVSDAGTAFTPGAYPTPPTDFTVLGSGLITSDGVRVNRDWATTYEYVLEYAEPIAELLDTALTTVMFDLVDASDEALGEVVGNSVSANVLDLTVSPGPLTEYALVLQQASSANGRDKSQALWFPRCTVKLNGETEYRGGKAVRTPVMLSVLYDITSGSAGKSYTEA